MTAKKADLEPGKKIKNRIFLPLNIILLFLLLVVIITFIALFQAPAPDPDRKVQLPGAFFSPVEENREQRLPLFNFAVNKLLFSRADKNRGWLIGDQGTVFTTANLGRTWQKQETLVTTVLTDIYMAADNTTGWVIGGQKTILHTVNGGKEWRLQQAPGADTTLIAVHFAQDKLTGWITTADGNVLYTENGGKNWNIQQTGADTWLGDIYIAGDNQDGWITGGNGLLLRKDGRYAEWQIAEQPPGFRCNRLHFSVNGTYGWIAGDSGIIRHTSDGGKTWELRQTGVPNNLLDIFFLEDNRTGWAAGAKGLILATRDGGSSWDKHKLPFGEDFTSIAYNVQDRSCWVSSADGTLFVSRDNGKNWHPVTRGASQFYHSLFFSADNKTAWVLGNDSHIYKTKNRGRSWEQQHNPAGDILYTVFFRADNQTGWAAGENGTILYTEDGGEHWINQYMITLPVSETARPGYSRPIPPGNFHALQFSSNGKTGWITGGKGAFAITTNGGALWVRRQFPVQNDFYTIYFSRDNRLGWAAGAEGVIYHTQDGGINWIQQHSGTGKPLRALQFAGDNRKGWAAGAGGTLLATEDGGNTWHLQPLSVPYDFEALHADAAGSNCWVAGASGSLYHSADGGQTWNRQETGVPYTLSAVHFADNNRQGWVCSRYRYVLYTDDGGNTWKQINAYRKLPAPWYYAALCLLTPAAFISALLAAQRRKKAAVSALEKFVGELLVTDKPLESDNADLLGFKPVAQGISRFIRNKNTSPPLTIAVTGQWGAGKSSLVNMVAHDLKAKRFFPVAFNAWHHQNQEQLLAGLLENIRLQGIPPLWRLRGVVFRLRLFLYRMRRFLPLFMLFIFINIILYFILSRITNHQDFITGILSVVKNITAGAGDSIALLGGTGIFAIIVNTGLLFYNLAKSIRPFGTNLNTFVKNLSGRFNACKMTGDAGFHYKFAREFGEVTKALKPYKLVILIDDLDRCRPANVITILEALNFLTASGDCIIILGLDLERVEKCIGLELHAEAVKLKDTAAIKNPDTTANAEVLYAKQYLEKLINLEIPLPGIEPGQMKSLLRDLGQDIPVPVEGIPGKTGFLFKLKTLLIRNKKAIRAGLVAFCFILLAVITGSWLSSLIPQPAALPRAHVQPADSGKSEPSLQLQPAAETAEPAADVHFLPVNESSTPGFYPGREDRWRPEFFLFGLPLILLGLYIIVKNTDEDIPEDSPLFRNALAAWEDTIFQKAKTPRAVKRFLNRIRYMAMRYVVWKKDRHLQMPEQEVPGSPAAAVREDFFVGLCVLYLTDPGALKDTGLLEQYIRSVKWPLFSAEGRKTGRLEPGDRQQMKILEANSEIFKEIFGGLSGL